MRVESGNERDAVKHRVLALHKATMGSLRNVMIARANGHEVDDERAANAQLDRLLDELWARAKAL